MSLVHGTYMIDTVLIHIMLKKVCFKLRKSVNSLISLGNPVHSRAAPHLKVTHFRFRWCDV